MKAAAMWAGGLLAMASSAQASDHYASVALVGTSGGSGGQVFTLACSTAGGGCNAAAFGSAFPGTAVNLTGQYDADGIRFDGAAAAWVESPTDLHAAASFSVSGPAGLPQAHNWLAQAMAGMSTRYTPVPDDSAALGDVVSVALRYRFEGTLSQSGGGDVLTSATARMQASTFMQQALACVPDPADPAYCLLDRFDAVYGEALPFSLLLQAAVQLTAQPSGATAYSGQLTADYGHTLSLTGVTLYDGKGRALNGWRWMATDEGLALFSSPVPEPAPGVLLGLGLSVLAWRARAAGRSARA